MHSILRGYRKREKARRLRLCAFIKQGVKIPCFDGVLIEEDVRIGKGTVILPGTILHGKTVIGEDCIIGPNCLFENAVLGSGCRINATQIYDSRLGNNVKIGPFCHIRPGSVLADGVKIGDFVEVKNSQVGEKTAIAHLTYVGDSDVGARVNFGCGTVTVNYDGVNKHRTVIGDDCFIGCNTNLIAPVKLGDGVYTGAGTTVTQDVPPQALVIGRSRQEVHEGWAEKIRRRREEKAAGKK